MAQGNTVYQVIIYRVDNQHFRSFESSDFNEVETVYKGLCEEWTNSTAEKRPFNLHPPHLHSMLPSLISEIKVEKMTIEEHRRQSNAFYDKMNRDGFNAAMNQNFHNR